MTAFDPKPVSTRSILEPKGPSTHGVRRGFAALAGSLLVSAGVARSQPAPPPPAWMPRTEAVLEVLDKINAASRDYTVRVGQSVQVGSLTIAVQSCQSRPPDQPADAAALLDITDSHAGEPGFRGWMLAQEPWVAMLQSPVYDVRVIQCQ
jgi:hypothetical protein